MARNHFRPANECQKEFVGIFQELCRTQSSWKVWQAVISAMACAISNRIDWSEEHWQSREDEYLRSIREVGDPDGVAKLFAIVVEAFERNPAQDFLGEMFMALDLGSNWKGQFFTPMSVCRMMSDVQIGSGAKEKIEKQGWISVSDPSCGAGATLIAAADTMKRQGIDYQNHVLFVGQDIDRLVAQMCYIQLSLLGCPGYVCVANTLSNPLTGDLLFPQELDGQELWFTPMFASDVWNGRRLWHRMDVMIRGAGKPEQKNVWYFDFEKKEVTRYVS